MYFAILMIQHCYFLFGFPKMDRVIDLFFSLVGLLFENGNDLGLNKLVETFFLSLKFSLMSNNDFDSFGLM